MLVNNDSKIYAGNNEIVKAYQGNTVIYEKQVAPPYYTPLEYLESTGTQYINSLYTPSLNTKIEIDFQFTSNTTYNYTRVFGCRSTWDNGFYLGTDMNRVGTSYSYWYLFSNKYRERGTINARFSLDRRVITLDKTVLTIDGVNEATINATTFTPYATICLFGAYDESETTPKTGIYKMYGCKLYESDVLVRDFIPVLDGDGTPCLYEKVEDKFYYNDGSGTFLYG